MTTISISRNKKLCGEIEIARTITDMHGITTHEGLNAVCEKLN